MLNGLLVFLGIKRKARPWGTVYNAVTKEPLAFAKVGLLGPDRRVLETHITDRAGMYGFLADTAMGLNSENEFQIEPAKEGYAFPSEKITGRSDSILYPNVYNGGTISVRKDDPIAFDIPLDPTKRADEFWPEKPVTGAFHNLFARISGAIFWIALIAVPANYLLNPNNLNLAMLIVFAGLNMLIFVGDLRQHPYGIILDEASETPLPYVLITLHEESSGVRKAFTVSDIRGRYFLLSDKGTFKLSAFSPAHIQPPRSTVDTIKIKKGWIAKKLYL